MAGKGTGRGKRRDWTDEEVATLQRMKAAGVGLTRIAAALGRSEDGVWSKWRAMNPDRYVGQVQRPKGGEITFRDVGPPIGQCPPDSSTPKFANHDLHLRLMAEAMRRGEHLPHRRAA